MNGRVYDYNLGRFLSVDPFIQSPGNSQSMNPYSYIMNNPLAGVDPSGYKIEEETKTNRVATTGSRIKREVSKTHTTTTTDDSTGEITSVTSVTIGNNGSYAGVSVSLSNGSVSSVTSFGGSSDKGASFSATADLMSQSSLSKVDNTGGDNSNAATLTSTAIGAGEHVVSDIVWVGENGQVKLNTPNYHGNKYNGSKVTQIALAKEIAKKLGVAATAVYSALRFQEAKSELSNLRLGGASDTDIALAKVDAGIDISMAVAGNLDRRAFFFSLVYTAADYAVGGNLSASVYYGSLEVAKSPERLRKNVIEIDNKIRKTWMDSFIRNFMPDNTRVAE